MDLLIELKTGSGRPLHEQLYQEMRRSILSGRLGAGQRVPSTRALAKSLGISRSTVTQTYDQLVSEGYLQTAIGSCTAVSFQLPDELLQAPPVRVHRETAAPRLSPRLSKYGARLAKWSRESDESSLLFNFKYGRTALDHFPVHTWRRILLRHFRSGRHELLDYAPDGKGSAALRSAIARYLTGARAVNCRAEQILIVNGSQQALQLIAQVLVNRGDIAALENPGYSGARQAFLAHGARRSWRTAPGCIQHRWMRRAFSRTACRGKERDLFM
jgi:GntR family transcriptional regulator/MocR family aminotransferase